MLSRLAPNSSRLDNRDSRKTSADPAVIPGAGQCGAISLLTQSPPQEYKFLCFLDL